MKSLQTSLFLALGVLFAGSAFAQDDAPASATTPASSSGLLGKRYVEASVFLVDYQNAPDNGFGVGTAINVPLTAHVDVGATFQHNWREGDRRDNFQDLTAYVTGYTTCGDFRPFARASLGYEWWNPSDDPFYQIDVGSEYLVNERLSFSAQVSWSEFLASDWNGGAFAGSARANYWITPVMATSATVTYNEGGTWACALGAVFVF